MKTITVEMLGTDSRTAAYTDAESSRGEAGPGNPPTDLCQVAQLTRRPMSHHSSSPFRPQCKPPACLGFYC